MSKKKDSISERLQEGYEAVPVGDVVSLPGKVVEKLTVGDVEAGETPLRGYEDLKQQYFGPTLLNKQRLLEVGDTALYQGAYALPGAAIGYGLGKVPGALAGLAIGKLLGQTHLYAKEKGRLDEARKEFNPRERELLDDISGTSTKWAVISGLLAALGVGGAAYAAGHDKFGPRLTPLLEAGGAGTLAALLGGLGGHALARRRAKNNKRYAGIIRRYERFN
jgi:hypothetical protein